MFEVLGKSAGVGAGGTASSSGSRAVCCVLSACDRRDTRDAQLAERPLMPLIPHNRMQARLGLDYARE